MGAKRPVGNPGEDYEIKFCDRCGARREHNLSLQVKRGAVRDDIREENKICSRNPHRVYRCIYCDTVTEEEV